MKSTHLVLLAVLHQSNSLIYSEAIQNAQNAHINDKISSSSDEVFATKEQLADLCMKDLIKSASYKEVMNSCQHNHWIVMMQVKINELIRIKIWKLVKSSREWKIIKECWVYHIKLNANNEIIKFKACWMIKNFKQIFNIDYDEIYVSISCHTMIQILLTLTVKYW